MTRRLPSLVGLFFAASATAPAGAHTPTIPPDYLCKPQQTATLSAGAQTATTPLDYLCKPQPATVSAPAEEQNAENARPADVTPHPEHDTAEVAAPAAPAPPAKVPVGTPIPPIEDLPQ
jgi:hypothetical protein